MNTQLVAAFDENILKQVAKIVSLCPTTDLALVVATDNTISLYRDGFTPGNTMAAPENADITSVEWNPNGKEFAVGCASGSVYKIELATFGEKAKPCWLPQNDNTARSRITCMSWVRYGDEHKNASASTDALFDPITALPNLSFVPPEGPAPLAAFQRVTKAILPTMPAVNPDNQTLLLIGDAQGVVHLSINGVYYIGSFDVSVAAEKAVMIEKINVSHSLSFMQILVRLENTYQSTFGLATMDMKFIKSRKTELSNVAVEHANISFLFKYIQQCMELLKKHHFTTSKLANDSANKITATLLEKNERVEAMPDIELAALLATGNTSEAVHIYLTQQLTEQNVKRWETRSNHSYSWIKTLICEYIQPAYERLLVHLSTLYGYSQWSERYGSIINTHHAQACVQSVRLMMMRLNAYFSEVSKVAESFQEFMKWILQMVQKHSDEGTTEYQNIPDSIISKNPRLVAEYLKSSFASDSLADFFAELPDISVADLLQHPNMLVKHHGLLQLLRNAEGMCQTMLETPSRTITSLSFARGYHWFNAGSMHQLLSPAVGGRRVASWMMEMDEPTATCYHYCAFSMFDGYNQQLILVRSILQSQSGAFEKSYCCVRVTDAVITDLEFYNDTVLAVVIQLKEEAQSLLSIIPHSDLPYQPLGNKISTDAPVLYQDVCLRNVLLQDMTGVIVGTNGRPKWESFATVASSGKAKTFLWEDIIM